MTLRGVLLLLAFFILLCSTGTEGARSRHRRKSRFQTFQEAQKLNDAQVPPNGAPATDFIGAILNENSFSKMERQFVHAFGSFGAAVQDISNLVDRLSGNKKRHQSLQEEDRAEFEQFLRDNGPHLQAPQETRGPDPQKNESMCSGWGLRLSRDQLCGSPSDRQCNATLSCNANYTTIDECTLEEITCVDGNTEFPFTPECRLHLLLCNGTTLVEDPRGMSSIEGCLVKQVACGTNIFDFSNVGEFSYCPTLLDVDDPNDPGPCINLCEAEGPCACTYDRIGRDCENWRPYECRYSLSYPEKICGELPDPRLDGDPPCFTDLSYDHTVRFTYTVNCTFSNFSGLDVDAFYQDQLNFTYFAIKNGDEFPTFAVSDKAAAESTFALRMKFYNFNMFSDNAATYYSNMSGSQLVGNRDVSFDVPFFEIPDRFYAGDRLYAETALDSTSPNLPETQYYDRQFIDLPDVKIKRSIEQELSANTITWIIVACIAGCCAVLVCIYWAKGRINTVRENRRTKKLQKEE